MTFVVAAIQKPPRYHDLHAGIVAAVQEINAAAKLGAKLIVFPEVWLQGYPYWASISVRDCRFQEFRRQLWVCSVENVASQLAPIADAAKANGTTVALGFHERVGRTIFNSIAFFGSTGALLGVRRKLVPTTTERLVWGRGDGSDLGAFDTPIGKVGGLICFEHQMAPARYVLADQGIDLHCALWPGHSFIDGVIDASTRHLAHENSCFVIVAREVFSVDHLLPDGPDVSDNPGRWAAHGGSAIIAPGGAYLAKPVFDQETIVTAEIDLNLVSDQAWWLDGTGHYARPDVFQVRWDARPKPAVDKT